MSFFVWVRGIRGPQPQKWAEIDYGIGEWRKKYILAYHMLSQKEDDMQLDQLAILYPYRDWENSPT